LNKVCGFALGAVAAILPMPAPAQIHPQDSEDARCAGALHLVAAKNGTPEDVKLRLGAIAMYYLGRLSSRHDGVATESLIDEQERQLDQSSIHAIAKKCTEGVGEFLSRKRQKE
jgi:hypothetical protein